MNIIKRPKDNYVYIHYNGLIPVYVGKGKERRVLTIANRPEYEWDGYRIVAEELTNSEALELEALITDTYGLNNLANIISGTKAYTGKKHSEETKAKMSKAATGRKRPDVAERNRIIKKGQDPWINRR